MQKWTSIRKSYALFGFCLSKAFKINKCYYVYKGTSKQSRSASWLLFLLQLLSLSLFIKLFLLFRYPIPPSLLFPPIIQDKLTFFAFLEFLAGKLISFTVFKRQYRWKSEGRRSIILGLRSRNHSWADKLISSLLFHQAVVIYDLFVWFSPVLLFIVILLFLVLRIWPRILFWKKFDALAGFLSLLKFLSSFEIVAISAWSNGSCFARFFCFLWGLNWIGLLLFPLFWYTLFIMLSLMHKSERSLFLLLFDRLFDFFAIFDLSVVLAYLPLLSFLLRLRNIRLFFFHLLNDLAVRLSCHLFFKEIEQKLRIGLFQIFIFVVCGRSSFLRNHQKYQRHCIFP